MGMPDPGTSDMPWQAILDQAAGPFAVIDMLGRYVYVNPALCRLHGYGRDELVGHAPREFTHPDDFGVDQAAIEQVLQGSTGSFEVEKRLLRPDGSVVWARVTSSIIRDSEGNPVFYLSQTNDITAHRELEQLWHRTMTNAPIGMALLDLNGHFTEVNDKLCELLGYSRDELLGTHFTAFVYPADLPAAEQTFAEVTTGGQDTVSTERRFRHKSGQPLWLLVRASVVPDADGQPAYLVSQLEQISGERLSDRHLAHLALYDPLTGLANRALLLDRLTRELAELPREEMVVLLLVDLDNLKPTNDRYGHAVGDSLLCVTANELLHSVRAGDTVARLGGDEFVVLTNMPGWAAAEEFRQRIAQRLNVDLFVSGHPLTLRASVGLAVTRNSTLSPEALLDNADRDMYARKQDATG